MHFFLYPAILQPGLLLVVMLGLLGLVAVCSVLFSADLLGSSHSDVDSRANVSGSLLNHCVIWKKLTSRFLVFLICLLSIIIVPAS